MEKNSKAYADYIRLYTHRTSETMKTMVESFQEMSKISGRHGNAITHSSAGKSVKNFFTGKTSYTVKESRGLTARQIFVDEWVSKCIAYGVKPHIVFDSKSIIQTSYEEFMLFATYVEVFYGWRRYIPMNDGPHYVIVNSTWEFEDKDIAYIIQRKMQIFQYVTMHIIEYLPEFIYQLPNDGTAGPSYCYITPRPPIVDEKFEYDPDDTIDCLLKNDMDEVTRDTMSTYAKLYIDRANSSK